MSKILKESANVLKSRYTQVSRNKNYEKFANTAENNLTS